MRSPNLYDRIIVEIFREKFSPGVTRVDFIREDIVRVCDKLGIPRPANLGDVLYSYRYRADLPAEIISAAPAGGTWVLWPAGKAKYRLEVAKRTAFPPSMQLSETKIPDSTPGLIELYAQGDEQALLARVRYNRLLDIFSGVTCYSLQSHLRTTAEGIGQLETDEVYVGIDRQGRHFVFPVQAKGRKEDLGVVQVFQDLAMCREKFPELICRPIGAKLVEPNFVALFEFEESGEGLGVASERHYRFVPSEDFPADELQRYRNRT
ncbi:MAG: endonuclease [Nitrososphaerales archaeon]